MIRPFSRTSEQEDFSKYFKAAETTKKQQLIAECQRRGVTIFVDDLAESSCGIYAKLRAVASKAELERRLQAQKAITSARYANIVAGIALLVSLAGLAKSIFWP